MNVQDPYIRDLIVRKNGLNQQWLLANDLIQKHHWSEEDYRQHGNKSLVSTEAQILNITIQLIDIDILLKKPFDQWTNEEREWFVDKAELRQEKAYLRTQLARNEELLLQLALVEKQKTPVQPSPSSLLNWTEVAVPRLTYDPTCSYFELDSNYVAETGIVGIKKLLFCRPSFHSQFVFLQKHVLEKNVRGWISGPPGVGKSITAFAFTCTLDTMEWSITWIHLSDKNTIKCVQLHNGRKRSCILSPNILSNLGQFLNDIDSKKKHFVIVDGYTHQIGQQQIILQHCNAWHFDKSEQVRRLLYVCSMSGRYKVNYEDDITDNVEEHFIYSWELNEYLDAVKSDTFFNNVKGSLDANEETVSNIVNLENREKLVHSKFYFAGGSCRNMFQYKTLTVMDRLNVAISCAHNIQDYAEASVIGTHSQGVINRLFNFYHETGLFGFIVSVYAGMVLSVRLGPDWIRSIAQIISTNAAMSGWLLEMWFFSCLNHCGVELCDAQGNVTETWPKSVHILNYTSALPKFTQYTAVWLKPLKWHQGGFDAIFIDKRESLVRFVQVTRGDTHSFKIHFFHLFLTMLRDSPDSFEVRKLEIYFLVAMEKLAIFKITEVEGKGLLKPFGPEWEHGSESESVKIIGLKGW